MSGNKASLILELENVDLALDLAKSTEGNLMVIEEIYLIKNKLEPLITSLEAFSGSREKINSHFEEELKEISKDESETLKKVAIPLIKLGKKLMENPEDIRQNNDLSDLVDSLTNYNTMLDNNSTNLWDEKLQKLDQSFRIGDVEKINARLIPNNLKSLEEYEKVNLEYEKIRRYPPVNNETLDELSELASVASNLSGKIVTTFPQYVTEFYELVDRDDGFPLEKLTTQLRRWLEDHDAHKELGIRRKKRL